MNNTIRELATFIMVLGSILILIGISSIIFTSKTVAEQTILVDVL